MKFTYYGHSCFQVETSGVKLLFDPFITPNPKAKGIDISKLKPDFILLSHAHFDHVADAVAIARQSGATVIANFEIINWVKSQGIENTHAFNTGGNKRFDWGNVKMVYALHSSSLPDGSYGGVAGGFVIETEDINFYYAGDTALSVEFQLIGDWYDLAFAVLPIGDNFTMGSEDAIVCSDMIDCDKIIGVHYDTFPVIEIDHEEVKKQFAEEDKELILLEIGQEIEL
jgi:L-ascorbate metabolism protein UlaG (beta-lactamase superfamily)